MADPPGKPTYIFLGGSQVVLVVKNLPTNAGNIIDASLISGS